MLIDKNMKKTDLLEAIEMSPNTLAKLGRNEDVSMDVLKRIYAVEKGTIFDMAEEYFLDLDEQIELDDDERELLRCLLRRAASVRPY